MLHITVLTVVFTTDVDHNSWLFQFFNLNMERNIPTYYSVISIFISSALLAAITMHNKNIDAPYYMWLALAIIFLFLSIDESIGIHESVGGLVQASFGASKYPIFDSIWVVPYGLFAIVMFIVYLKFLSRLSKQVMILFVVSGAIYVFGAIGFEMIIAKVRSMPQLGTLSRILLFSCEEFLEMLGIAIFNYALLTHICMDSKSIELTIRRQ